MKNERKRSAADRCQPRNKNMYPARGSYTRHTIRIDRHLHMMGCFLFCFGFQINLFSCCVYLENHGPQLQIKVFDRVTIAQQANALHVEPGWAKKGNNNNIYINTNNYGKWNKS